MTKSEQYNFSAKHIRRMKLFERELIPGILKALHEQIKPVAAKLRRHGIEAALNSLDTVEINSHLSAPIQEIYKTVGLYFANKTIHDINQSVKEVKAGFGFNADFLRAILNYFAQYLLNKAVLPISETTRRQIEDAINYGMEQGYGVDKIANTLESSEFTIQRARLIVRTEANKAMNYGQRLGADASEFEQTKEWVAANDHRTRHSHRFINGTILDLNERFMVPIYTGGKIQIQKGVDLMTGPGDVHASAGNVCNCRCTLAFIAKRDEKGRIIMKPISKITVNG